MCLHCRRPRFDPWAGKIPWSREWQPTPVFFPGEFQGHRSLADYSPWGRTEVKTTERPALPLSLKESVLACAQLSECVPPGELQPARLPGPGPLQARVLEWLAVPFSRGSSRPRDRTCVSPVCPAPVSKLFTTVPPGKPKQVLP